MVWQLAAFGPGSWQLGSFWRWQLVRQAAGSSSWNKVIPAANEKVTFYIGKHTLSLAAGITLFQFELLAGGRQLLADYR